MIEEYVLCSRKQLYEWLILKDKRYENELYTIFTHFWDKIYLEDAFFVTINNMLKEDMLILEKLVIDKKIIQKLEEEFKESKEGEGKTHKSMREFASQELEKIGSKYINFERECSYGRADVYSALCNNLVLCKN